MINPDLEKDFDPFYGDRMVKIVFIGTNISEEEITEAVIDRIMDMKKYPSDEKITEIAFEEMYEILVEEIKEPTYSDEKIVQSVGVHKDEDGMYYISEEDMLALDNVFFDLENK